MTDPIDFIHGLNFAQLPPEVVHQARRCLLDLVGVAISGRQTQLSRIAHDFAVDHLGAGHKGARLLFDGRRASAAGAAFAGATTIDSFDAHDGHALTKGHAGVAILPTLLAVADAEGLLDEGALDGEALLTCLVLGYEIATRAGIALHASACDYHTSGAWNALGCAAVAAHLLGLDSERTRHALGIAEYHGPRSQMMRCIDHPTMVKDGSGWGALAGVSAAYLAKDGFTGAPAITMEAPEQAAIWADLGERWLILDQYFKPWPVCRWAQPAIEAASSLLGGYDFEASDIDLIEVETFHEAVRLGAQLPATTEAAQYAIGFPLAAFIVRGRLGAEEIGGGGLADPAIQGMLRRIRLVEAAEFSWCFPAERLARLRIILKSGQIVESETMTARGDRGRPLSDSDLLAKFSSSAARLGSERSAHLSHGCMTLAAGSTAGQLCGGLFSPI
ncbi:2-methylcitrate dehydratase PrpD [Bosea sp. 62]|uniref:MmgE/PrpD family protein n=1 Tax=unclassified Bosea (in: a-proteobacteria) TaxID=2653178 RepID=UPI001259EF20|nr:MULTISPECIES: MmgE/PrpD family protein [unclassified Bosea (in: a-proteobacteria)]CAD5255679.1 2-methylcitrate dehydratase PrpD [Bosea sp. 46]CAD5259623.1 2-methylcitrate dehydratase PrpD [Bosea sp. 21B]CAD5281082.1 2-methylcitrate dehydratase PrpD [Bosea sp. 7B]VVT58071.1 2-methylcitrate dehydratase PrpD [Bosea sp. EC-HK365B]VXB46165.1 2-methylcitrate dehydratase PrpD [Bosea sp. 29B]